MASRTASRPSATRAGARKRCSYNGCRRFAPPGRKRCDDHKPGARPPGRGRKLMGRTAPRIWTRPLRPLNKHTSLGYEVIEFAEMIGVPLLPWEQWAAIHALELLPDGTFRFRIILIKVARQNGKSHLKRVISLWRMYMNSKTRVLGVAQDVALAREQWDMCQDTIHETPDLDAEWGDVRKVNGDEKFWIDNGSRYAIKAANRRAGRGGSNDEVNIDELREQRDWKAWAAVSKTTMARPNSQIWCMSNEGDDESVVLNQLTDAALSGRDPGMCILEWSAEPGCELDDWTQIAQANPGLGYIISEAAIRTALVSDDPAVFRTEVLCQRVDRLDSAVDLVAWKGCGDPAGTMDGLRDRLATVFDVAPDGAHCTLMAGGKLADGRVRLEVVKAWATTDAARAEITAELAKVKPIAFGWYSTGPAAALATVLRALARRYNRRSGKRNPDEIPEDGELTGSTVTEICQGLADMVKALRVIHPVDPLLDAHIAAAKKLNSGDGWRFVRRGSEDTGHVDAAYCAAGCVHIALTMPEPKRARIRMLG